MEMMMEEARKMGTWLDRGRERREAKHGGLERG
jgi:hypothetical protein